jgi:hypothetical protein
VGARGFAAEAAHDPSSYDGVIAVEMFRTLASPLLLVGTARGSATADPDDEATSARADMSDQLAKRGVSATPSGTAPADEAR